MWGTAFFNADLKFFDVDVLVPRSFGAETFCRRYVLALYHFAVEEQKFAFSVWDTGYFSYELCCRKFFYRRLTCTRIYETLKTIFALSIAQQGYRTMCEHAKRLAGMQCIQRVYLRTVSRRRMATYNVNAPNRRLIIRVLGFIGSWSKMNPRFYRRSIAYNYVS